MSWKDELARALPGCVSTDERARESVASDFGRVIHRLPQAVVRPSSTEDVRQAMRFAAARSIPVSARGAGHSEAGQSLSDGMVLDLTSLRRILRIDADAQTVICQGGASWRSLLEQLQGMRLAPPVLTNNLDVTVGGTLSTAGLGVASWRHGTQADHCLELEVVTGEGRVVRCSPAHEPELFDAVRAGLGQFGVITEATLALRRYRPRTRTVYLLYDQLNVLLDDLKRLMVEERFDYLESWCVPCPQGFRKTGSGKQVFAQWFFPLHATLEFDSDSPASLTELLRDLQFYRHVHTEESDTVEFFSRLDPLFRLWKLGGFWDFAHPWMECVLPWEAAGFYVGQVLENLPPTAVAGGHILLWPARAAASSVPLFARPSGEYVLGFGILPAVPPPLLDEALPRIDQASRAAMMLGGKRYLSGWIEFDRAQWKAHFGDHWTHVRELKRKFDPQGILSRGFLKTEDV